MTPLRGQTRGDALDAECPHETAVAAAARDGRRLADADDPLAAHVGACPACRDVATLVALLGEGPSQLRGDVSVPSAGQVWWRTIVRARLEDTKRAARPMMWAQALAAVVLGTAGVALARVAAASPDGPVARAWAWLADHLPASDGIVARLAALPGPFVWTAIAVALSIVVVPLVAVLASRGD